MTDKQIIFKCDVDCIKKNTEECFELECIYGQESILKQLQAKEQECEKFKDIANRTLDKLNKYLDKQVKLDQLKLQLAEIKELMEIEIECKTYEIENDCFNEIRCKALKEHIDFTNHILQKISECED